MEKIKVNNQIVLMRKFVKQAKVHAINKLVKEVKLLQNRKGKDAQIQKAKRKSERCLEEIVLLKKTKPDDVSKLALSRFKNWKDVLQQKNSTLEERCIAMLANYEAVQKEVEVFHSSNQNLVSKIPDLIKELEQRSKLPKDVPKGAKSSEVQQKIDKSKKEKNNLPNVINESLEELSHVPSCLKKKNNIKREQSSQIACEGDVVENSVSFIRDIDGDTQKVEINKIPRRRKIEYTENSIKCENKNSPVEFSENAVTDEEAEISCSKDESLSEVVIEMEMSKNAESDEESEESYSSNEREIEVEKSDFDEESNSENEDSENISADDMEEEMLHIKRKTNKGKVDNKKIISPNRSVDLIHKSKKRKLSDNQNVLVKKVPDNKVSNTENYKVSNDSSSTLYKAKQDFTQSFKVPIETNLKTVTMLNLDDLEGLDEIPLNKEVKFEEETDEDEAKHLPKKKISDPFFLGYKGLDAGDDKMNNQEDKRNFFISKQDNGRQRERSTSFGKNKRSNFQNNFKKDYGKSNNYKRDLQNSPKSSQFSKESYKFKSERNNFNKGNFQSKNYQEKFQSKGKNKFYSEDQRDFNRRGNGFRSYEKKSHEGANKLYLKNEDSNSFRKYKVPNKKGNESEKPLHPSWQAKRKQKELIHTPFQGKRMVFDD